MPRALAAANRGPIGAARCELWFEAPRKAGDMAWDRDERARLWLGGLLATLVLMTGCQSATSPTGQSGSDRPTTTGGSDRATAATTSTAPGVVEVKPTPQTSVFFHHRGGWSVTGERGQVVRLTKDEATLTIMAEEHSSHDGALKKLLAMRHEAPVESRMEAIAGRPGFYRSYIETQKPSEHSAVREAIDVYHTTIAFVSGSLVVRGDARVPVDGGNWAEQELDGIVKSASLDPVPKASLEQDLSWLGRQIESADEATRLHNAVVPPSRNQTTRSSRAPIVKSSPSVQPSASRSPQATPDPSSAAIREESEGETAIGAANAIPARSDPVDVDAEVEIGVDASGEHIVIGNNGGFPVDITVSNDFGFSFFNCGGPGCAISAPPANHASCGGGGPCPTGTGGDPSVSVGVSGTLYVTSIAWSAQACGTHIYASSFATAGPNIGDIDGFDWQSVAAYSAPADTNGDGVIDNVGIFPDQHHIAADPFAADPGGGDRIYSVYRQFNNCQNPSGFLGPALVCSADGGATWSAPVPLSGGDFPRVTVAADSTVLVSYMNGNTPTLERFSPCAQGAPPTIARVAGPVTTVLAGSASPLNCTNADAIPGLDRCNVGNDLRSTMVAGGPAGQNTVFYSYAASRGNTTDDIVVETSTDGGLTFTGSFTMNSTATGHRFMPWICSGNGTAMVSWYDMRNSGAMGGNPGDLDYFGRSLTDNLNGTFTLNDEFQINDSLDNSCNVGFPGGILTSGANTATTTDMCPDSQLAGFCQDANGNGFDALGQPYGTTLDPFGNARCDFSDCGSTLSSDTTVDNPCTCAVQDVSPRDGVPDASGTLTSCNGVRGAPKYGDYNGNACVGGRLYAAWAQGDATAATPPADGNMDGLPDWSYDVDVLFKCSTNPGDASSDPYTDRTAPTLQDVPASPPTLQGCGIVSLTEPTALDICGDPNPDIIATVDGNEVDLSTFVFPPGTRDIVWTAEDADGNVSTASTTSVTVVDNTPPVVVPPPSRTEVSCTAGGLIAVGEATATDDCAGVLVADGFVVESNGVAVVPPIPVVDGEVNLGLGTHVIEWSASDGVQTTTEEQIVTVGAAIIASNTYQVRDRSSVVDLNGDPAAVLNSGGGITAIGGDGAAVGEIIAGGNVSVSWNGYVYGDITAVGSVSVNDPTKHFGSIVPVPSVALPAPPALPAFPPASGGDQWVNPGTDLTLPPGSYGQIGVNGNPNPNNAAIVRLSAGDYFFTNLYFNSAGLVVVGAPGTRIFVSGNVTFNTSIVTAVGSGELAPVTLGVSGPGSLALYAPFTGLLIAPQRDLVVGTANGMTFTGSFYARGIDVTPNSDLVCDPSAASQEPPACSNGMVDVGETDVDCGGPVCEDCADGSSCSVGTDCVSKVCPAGFCEAPTCSDGEQNGTETGEDCGGPCPACPPTCNGYTYQAESMGHSTGNAWWQGGWNIYSNGYIWTNHNFTAGANVITISAFGQQAQNVLPHMRVTVNGAAASPSGGVNVTTNGFNNYAFTYTASTAGSREIRVIFDNDASGWFGDRNLIVRTATVSCP